MAIMLNTEKLIFETDTKFGHYQVVDMVYLGRPARVLFSGQRAAAQSGVPKDGGSTMLFDYNQRFMELTSALRPKNLLLIGGGAFTLPVQILKFFPDTKIDVVELDPELEKIAEAFFELQQDNRLKIIFGDGREYLKASSEKYDLILLDAFTHNVIPAALSTKEFMEILSQHLSKVGVAASNIISA
jgi:spermidine synthase